MFTSDPSRCAPDRVASGHLLCDRDEAGRVVASHAIPVAGLASNVYSTYIVPSVGKPDRLQLVWRGRSELFVNGFLALAAGDLERLAVWHGAWPATSP